MKFEFETGEVIEVFDNGIAQIIRNDKRYKEISIKKDSTSKEENVKKDSTSKEGNPDGKVQK